MQDKHKSRIAHVLSEIADRIELAVAVVLIFGILVLLVQMVGEYVISTAAYGRFNLSAFLSDALNLVIGLEFVKMLCNHTPETVVEVVLIATARQIIVVHGTAMDTFLRVITIAILCAVTYLLPDGDEDKPRFSRLWLRTGSKEAAELALEAEQTMAE